MMPEKRFIVIQNGNLFTVKDTVKNKPMGVFEFKENEFSVFACLCMIIDKMNELHKENKKLQEQISCENIYFGYLRVLYDWNKKVEKENKRLKKETQQLEDLILHMGYTIKNENGTITLELKQ